MTTPIVTRGDIDPDQHASEEGEFGPGLDQTSARRIARALGGIAHGARRGQRRWLTGGWSPHELWIVTTLDHRYVLHDGIDRRPLEVQAARPLPDLGDSPA